MKGIFISARTNSTRLPKKALIDIHDKPSIQYLIDNLKKSKQTDDVVLCTTLGKEDDKLCDIAYKSGIKYYRGSTEDKLERWLGACKKYRVDFFVTADGDDLFCDYGLIDHVFKQHEESGCDFIDGRGLYNDVYGISRKGLELVCDKKTNNDTEFIKLYFENHKDILKIEKIKDAPPIYEKKDIRMTLDYEEDLTFFRTVIGHFIDSGKEMTFENILCFLQVHKSIIDINWHREQSWKDNQARMIEEITKKGL